MTAMPHPGTPRSLSSQRCFNHAAREAVARCPECGGYFCRECITEHDDRVLCSACLKKLAGVRFLRRPAFIRAAHFLQCACGVLVVWFFFYLIGDGLVRLPDAFHEGTLWRVHWFDKE